MLDQKIIFSLFYFELMHSVGTKTYSLMSKQIKYLTLRSIYSIKRVHILNAIRFSI